MASPNLEERVAALEAELKHIKQQQVLPPLTESEPWWKKIVAIYKDDPAFDEAERLGREWRESSRPVDYVKIPWNEFQGYRVRLSASADIRRDRFAVPMSTQVDNRPSQPQNEFWGLRLTKLCKRSNAKLLTRNLKDFGKVPRLRAEDWSA